MGKINDFELQIDERGQNREDALFMMSDEEKNDLEYLFLRSFALYIFQAIPE